jgi:Tfp pilus assembly protein PilV
MCAVVVLTVGVLSMALLSARTQTTGQRSKYMSMAAILASEKLEDLNRWTGNDPQICVPTGTASLGSLNADVLQTTACDTGASSSVSYYDDVSITLVDNSGDCPNSTAGCFAETVSTQSGGTVEFTTTYHAPSGQIVTGSPSETAPGNMTFHRRWIVEANTPVAGTRRLTILVTLVNSSISTSFQMSLVRP